VPCRDLNQIDGRKNDKQQQKMARNDRGRNESRIPPRLGNSGHFRYRRDGLLYQNGKQARSWPEQQNYHG
jgi:hypothetical protein